MKHTFGLTVQNNILKKHMYTNYKLYFINENQVDKHLLTWDLIRKKYVGIHCFCKIIKYVPIKMEFSTTKVT